MLRIYYDYDKSNVWSIIGIYYILDLQKLHRITNHPVHIFEEDGTMSPSAFIPFCQFGTNMLSMGVQTKMFKMPVCTKFKAKIFYNQLCYEVDPNKFIDRNLPNIEKELKLGLSLLVDTNFNRHYSVRKRINTASINETLG